MSASGNDNNVAAAGEALPVVNGDVPPATTNNVHAKGVPENLLQVKMPCVTDDEEPVEVEIGLLLQSHTFKNMVFFYSFFKKIGLEVE
jgi:hypothetical protein